MPAVAQPDAVLSKLNALLSVLASVANTSAPLVMVVIPGMVISPFRPGLAKSLFTWATSTAHVFALALGLKTCITTVKALVFVLETLGLADHVPLKRAQNILCETLVVFAVFAVQVCPPVLDIAKLPPVSLELPTRIIRSPTTMLAGGVTAVGDTPELALSAGVEAEPK